MTTETTEQETPQKLEEVPSTEVEEVSEEEEPEDKFETRVQAEADKRVNPYREKREADTALIRKLQDDLKASKKQSLDKIGGAKIKELLSGYKEEEHSAEEVKTFEENLKSINKEIAEYNEKSDEVEEMAQLLGDIAEKLPAKAVKGFGLDDPNPTVRAKNYAEFLNESIFAFTHNADFLMAIEEFLPKGDEVRKQLEELVEGMAEFESEKSKKLYLADKLKGLKVPRKKPPTPSDSEGGGSSDKDFIAKYNTGEINSPADHKRAAEILDKLRRS